MRIALRILAFISAIVVAISFYYYSSAEDLVLSPNHREPDASAGRTIEFPIKGTSVYVTPSEYGQISLSQEVMIGGFGVLMVLGLADYLTRKKK